MITLKYNKYTFFFLIVLSALLINPIIYKSNASIQRYIFYILCLIYLFLNNHTSSILLGTCVTKLKSFLLLILFWFLWAFLLPNISSTHEYSFLMNFVYAVEGGIPLLVLGVISYKYSYKSGDEPVAFFCQLYCWGMVLYVFGSILMLVFPKLHEFALYNLVVIDRDRWLLTAYPQYYSRIGWAGIATYGTSLKCTLAFVCAMYLCHISEKSKERKTYILGCVFLFIGNVLYARTGMIICALIALTDISLLLLKRNKVKQFIGGIVILGVCVCVIYLVLNKYSHNSSVSWMFEFIYKYMNTGKLSTNSTETLKNTMLFLPSLQTLLCGDALYTDNGVYYMKTDIGFMRMILYGGVFFCVFGYSIVASLFRLFSGKKRENYFMIMNLVLTFVLYEIKGETFVILIPFLILLCAMKYMSEMKTI